MPLLLGLLSVLVMLSACGSADPEPSGLRPPRASPSLPSVANGVSQTGVPRLVNLVVTGGEVTGVESIVEIGINTPLRLTVLSDVADVLLVRNYDLRAQLPVDQPTQLEFLAGRTGDVAVVLEQSGIVLTTLRVS